MKRYSIKTKLTLWYSIIIFLFLSALYAAIYLLISFILNHQITDMIKKSADDIADNVQYINGRLIPAPGHYHEELIMKGVLYVIYSHDNYVIDGVDHFSSMSFKEGLDKIVQIYYQRDHWFIYDRPIHYGNLYIGKVRIIFSATRLVKSLDKIKYIGLIMFIPGIFISYSIGKLLSESALRSIRNITKVTRQFGYGELGTRINTDLDDDEIEKLAKTLNNMADSLQQALTREKQFTSNLSHEIRTPIAVIITNAEDAKYDDKIETYRKTNEIVLEKSIQLQKLLTQLLSLSRENEQVIKMELEEINLFYAVNNTAYEARFWAKKKNIKIKTSLQKDIIIKADLTLLTRMLVNLIHNAIRYGRQDGRIEIKTFTDNEMNGIISVCDNGIGIAAKDLPHIFDRFYRVDKSRTDAGSGLGLSFVDMIAKLHGGHVSVSSKLGEGTCFIVTLPRYHSTV